MFNLDNIINLFQEYSTISIPISLIINIIIALVGVVPSVFVTGANIIFFGPSLGFIISLLGEKDNIEDIDACMTRLRVTVKDISLVANESEWKKNGALGLIIRDKGVQAIYGPKADILKSNIQDILGV